jgi:hypothetical protein
MTTMKTEAQVKESTSTKEVFESLLAQMKHNAIESQNAFYAGIIAKAKSTKTNGEMEDAFKLRNGWYPPYYFTKVRGLLDYEAQRYGSSKTTPLIFKNDLQIAGMVAKWVADDVDAMFASFIAKQTAKTEGIIKGRALRVSGYIVGNLECELLFTLADGAGFKMKTQIVWKCNQRGTHFWQFPTTFHDATNKDGEAISRPSEARLKELL